MTIKLISLEVITLFLLSGHSYSEEQFLFPKKKPSIFKNIKNSNKIDLSKNLPQRKPLIKNEEDIKKDKEVKKKDPNIKTIHFVAPQVWVWREHRVKQLNQIKLWVMFDNHRFDISDSWFLGVKGPFLMPDL